MIVSEIIKRDDSEIINEEDKDTEIVTIQSHPTKI